MWFFDPTLLLFLLLPVAAFSGWVIGRRHDSQGDNRARQNLPPEYLQELNFFLSDQPDKAIDLVIQNLEVTKDTFETHLALGSLYRRHGEVDRATRIHQNLLAQPVLNPEFRAKVMQELGQDYMRAGLLDRAEAVFNELALTFPKTQLGLLQLMDIYQQEREWHKAIDVASKLPPKQRKEHHVMIAQFHCEIAESALKEQEYAAVQHHARKALDSDNTCARANLLLGNLALQREEYSLAIEYYQRIEGQSPDVIVEVVDFIVRSYEALNQQVQLRNYLLQLIERHPYIVLIIKTAEIIKSQSGETSAREFLENELKKRPSLRGVERLLESHLLDVKGEIHDKLLIIKTVLAQMLKNRPTYQCVHCGFGSRILYWQCPGCREWTTIRPIQGVEGVK